MFEGISGQVLQRSTLTPQVGKDKLSEQLQGPMYKDPFNFITFFHTELAQLVLCLWVDGDNTELAEDMSLLEEFDSV